MGWVRQKIADRQTAIMSLTPLWNSLRDSIGDAITEFTGLVSQPGVDYMDCRARGPMCMRVQKPGKFIEVFLSQSDQKVKSSIGVINLGGETGTSDDHEICSYRLTEDRSALEFCISGEAHDLSADEVAQRALEQFLLEPFPTQYIRHEKL